MVSIVRSLLTAAVAFTGVADCVSHAGAHRTRAENTVTPVGDPVQVDKGGSYMRTARLENGDLLGTYSIVDGSDITIRTVRSSNGGGSWERLGEVARGPSSTRDIDNAFPLELPGGRLVVAFRNHDKEPDSKFGFTWFRITLCESTDGGRTWKYVSQVSEREATDRFKGLWEPLLRIADDGSLQVYFSYEHSSGDQNNIMRSSTDGGQTWSEVSQVSGPNVHARDGMVGIAKIADDTLMCVFESTEIGRMSVHYILSHDDGKTWDSRTLLYEATGGNLAGAPQITKCGGTIVVNFMSTEKEPSTGVDGGEQKVITSTDGGKTWSDPYVVSGLGSHWPALQHSNTEEFLSLYSKDGEGMLVHRHRV